jgi:peptide/nickel transport system substrate-binding protein
MISRRGVMAAGAGLVAARQASAQALARQQRVNVGLGYGDLRSLDPHLATASSDIPVLPHIYEGLLRLTDSRTSGVPPQPGLAERWESADDDQLWTFHLRRGVAWHGEYGEFTAEDAKFSIERILDSRLGSPFRTNLRMVERVTADGPHTLRVKLREPYRDLPLALVNYQMGFVVCRRAIEGGVDPTRQPVGTGPFRFAEYRPRESLTVRRNDAYWGGRAQIEQITWYFMSESAPRELALRTGDLNAIDIDARQDVVERLRRRGATVDVSRSGSPYALFINLTKKPFDDLRVRQALAHATNREELIAFSGTDLTSPEVSAVPAGYDGATDKVRSYAHDPARARALLAEAGLPNGFTTTAVVSNSILYLPYMNVLREQWRRAGITVDFQVVDHPTFHRMIRQDASALVIYSASRYPRTAEVYLSQFYAKEASIGLPTAATNFAHYGEAMPGIDEMLAASRASRVAAERLAILERLQQKIAEDLPVIPLFTKKTPMARSPKLDLGAAIGDVPYYVFDLRTRVLA